MSYGQAVCVCRTPFEIADIDFLEEVDDCLKRSFEGYYIDLEFQNEKFLARIKKFRRLYSPFRAAQIIIRYCRETRPAEIT